MPKIQIDVPQDTYDKLKQKAKERYQSLRSYVTYHLIEYINNPNSNVNNPNSNVIDLSNLPGGTVIKATAPQVLSPEELREQKYNNFQKLARQIVGHTLDVEDYRIMDFDSGHSYYDKSFEEPLKEGSAAKCVYIYNLPESRQREFLEEFKHYEN